MICNIKSSLVIMTRNCSYSGQQMVEIFTRQRENYLSDCTRPLEWENRILLSVKVGCKIDAPYSVCNSIELVHTKGTCNSQHGMQQGLICRAIVQSVNQGMWSNYSASDSLTVKIETTLSSHCLASGEDRNPGICEPVNIYS